MFEADWVARPLGPVLISKNGPEPDCSGPGPDYSDRNEAALFNPIYALVFPVFSVAQSVDRTLVPAT